jgi:hypothetical protein
MAQLIMMRHKVCIARSMHGTPQRTDVDAS